MVFGIGEGKIDIIPEKQSYAFGEAIGGKVVLQLSQPKKANGSRIRFYGLIKTQHSDRDMHGHRHTHASTREVLAQSFQLAEEGDFPAGTKEYPFTIKLPTIPKDGNAGSGGFLSGIAGILGATQDPLLNAEWYLDASLDLPMSFDISKKLRLNLIR
ncbi:MAG: hypothetical protein PHS02_03080 [Candidatus ainarchaeum sp.]|nr:hypothetical protein [Candidatus ainarchaeum sp.]